MAHPYAAYWDRGESNVPDMTGARHVMDGRDLEAVCAALEIETPIPDVLDVGCGTGRLARLCDGYYGVDITPSAIAYCATRCIPASLIVDPHDLPSGARQWIACISVFTHISRSERMAYLFRFSQIAPNVLVDIIPGDGSGAVEMWTAEPDAFEEDVRRAGFEVVGHYSHAWDNSLHRYYRLRRVG